MPTNFPDNGEISKVAGEASRFSSKTTLFEVITMQSSGRISPGDVAVDGMLRMTIEKFRLQLAPNPSITGYGADPGLLIAKNMHTFRGMRDYKSMGDRSYTPVYHQATEPLVCIIDWCFVFGRTPAHRDENARNETTPFC